MLNWPGDFSRPVKKLSDRQSEGADPVLMAEKKFAISIEVDIRTPSRKLRKRAKVDIG
jgi:hypothetical protein